MLELGASCYSESTQFLQEGMSPMAITHHHIVCFETAPVKHVFVFSCMGLFADSDTESRRPVFPALLLPYATLLYVLSNWVSPKTSSVVCSPLKTVARHFSALVVVVASCTETVGKAYTKDSQEKRNHEQHMP